MFILPMDLDPMLLVEGLRGLKSSYRPNLRNALMNLGCENGFSSEGIETDIVAEWCWNGRAQGPAAIRGWQLPRKILIVEQL